MTAALFTRHTTKSWLSLAFGFLMGTGLQAGMPSRMQNLIPVPASVTSTGVTFALQRGAKIQVKPASTELKALGHYLAGRLNPATGYGLNVVPGTKSPAKGSILLTTEGADPTLGEEGYELKVARDRVTIIAPKPAGLFYGIQTLRQLLPAKVEATKPQEGPFPIPTGVIRDTPRFPWRGFSMDIARCFFGPEEIKRTIDLMAAYKLNRLHLHLSDDQGWRIEIKSWPKLTTVSGPTSMAGATGGFLTQAEYAGIVAYAQSRYIMVIPEIDMPGHTNAALVAYPELNCDGIAPKPYTGMEVGFSSLCIAKEITYRFVDDVVRELAAITPGPYLHIGGDEAHKTPEADFTAFITRAMAIVKARGKQVIGWGEIAKAEKLQGAIVQHWTPNAPDLAKAAVEKGSKLIMSPASRAYLDMKYTASDKIGQDWAGLIEVKDAYEWDPATFVGEVKEAHLLGIEAALWTETIRTRGDLDWMIFPRLPGIAEIAWSPAADRNWKEYRDRLAAHGERLSILGVGFHKSPQVPW
jgi:hexosaminidase